MCFIFKWTNINVVLGARGNSVRLYAAICHNSHEERSSVTRTADALNTGVKTAVSCTGQEIERFSRAAYASSSLQMEVWSL
jgi:hypothetical protein